LRRLGSRSCPGSKSADEGFEHLVPADLDERIGDVRSSRSASIAAAATIGIAGKRRTASLSAISGLAYLMGDDSDPGASAHAIGGRPLSRRRAHGPPWGRARSVPTIRAPAL